MTDPNATGPDVTELADDVQRRKLHQRVNNDVRYHAPGDVARLAHEQLRREADRLAHLAIEICPPGRELSLGLTKLIDEALAHFNAAVARNHDRLRPPDDIAGTEWTYD